MAARGSISEAITRARARAQADEPPHVESGSPEYVRPAWCANCHLTLPGQTPANQATRAQYCPECARLLRDADRAYAELAQRRERGLALGLEQPLPQPVDDDGLSVREACQRERRAAGLLDHAKPGTRYLAERYPDLAFLAYQTSPALDFWRDTREILAEFFSDVAPQEWTLLFAEAAA
jgi:hypothetical protein